ncbi:MAG: M56 family metallopeptidase [Muribaculaceae bacterium]|nr:M56 family metallopeptidase [Muribaculaceae bacterium]
MGALFSYSVISSLILLVMYLVYKWILAGEKQYAFNRVVLWGIYVVSLVAPLSVPALGSLRHAVAAAPAAAGVIDVGVMAFMPVQEETSVLPRIILWIYIAGMAASVIMTAVTAVRLCAVIRSGRRSRLGRYTLVVTPGRGVAPFSWLRYIVLSEDDYAASGGVIVTHELRHLDAAHWVDMLLAQMVCVMQWFNPAAWLMREELKSVHEYQADEAVIASGADVRSYQMLLIKKAVGARFPSIANSLNHSKLKKRVTMMYKSKSSVAGRLRALALVPAGALALMAVQIPAVASALDSASATTLTVSGGKDTKSTATDKNTSATTIRISKAEGAADGNVEYYIDGKLATKEELTSMASGNVKSVDVVKNTSPQQERLLTMAAGSGSEASAAKEEEPVKTAEVMPEYPGGMQEMMNYVARNLRYPEEAMKANKEGMVVVQFVVSSSGKVKSPKIIRGISPELDAEAMRVVESMPAWTPGKVDGKPVACVFTLPVSFKLERDTKPKAVPASSAE